MPPQHFLLSCLLLSVSISSWLAAFCDKLCGYVLCCVVLVILFYSIIFSFFSFFSFLFFSVVCLLLLFVCLLLLLSFICPSYPPPKRTHTLWTGQEQDRRAGMDGQQGRRWRVAPGRHTVVTPPTAPRRYYREQRVAYAAAGRLSPYAALHVAWLLSTLYPFYARPGISVNASRTSIRDALPPSALASRFPFSFHMPVVVTRAHTRIRMDGGDTRTRFHYLLARSAQAACDGMTLPSPGFTMPFFSLPRIPWFPRLAATAFFTYNCILPTLARTLYLCYAGVQDAQHDPPPILGSFFSFSFPFLFLILSYLSFFLSFLATS